ncbi:MAG: hypothetical protein AB1489_27720 [Acidobacteriota bacterium]
MTDRNDKGIKDMFKQVYEMWERSATEQLERFARSQAFLGAVAQNLEQSLNITQRVRDMTQTTLGMMNLPTRQDVGGLAKQLKALQATLDEVNEKLDLLLPATSKTKSKKARKSKATS